MADVDSVVVVAFPRTPLDNAASVWSINCRESTEQVSGPAPAPAPVVAATSLFGGQQSGGGFGVFGGSFGAAAVAPAPAPAPVPSGSFAFSSPPQMSTSHLRKCLSASLISLGDGLVECVCPQGGLQRWAKPPLSVFGSTAAAAGDIVFLSVQSPWGVSVDGAIFAALNDAFKWRGVYKVVGAGHPHGDVQKARLILRSAYPPYPQLHFSHSALDHHVAIFQQDDQQWVCESMEAKDREHALSQLVSAVNGLLAGQRAFRAQIAGLVAEVAQLRQQKASGAAGKEAM